MFRQLHALDFNGTTLKEKTSTLPAKSATNDGSDETFLHRVNDIRS